jgi:hypothetical protein
MKEMMLQRPIIIVRRIIAGVDVERTRIPSKIATRQDNNQRALWCRGVVNVVWCGVVRVRKILGHASFCIFVDTLLQQFLL